MSKFQSYAARFAAKEAVYKAISPETSEDVLWRDVEVVNQENGKPNIKLHGKLGEIATQNGIADEKIEISLSHDDSFAVATVVINR